MKGFEQLKSVSTFWTLKSLGLLHKLKLMRNISQKLTHLSVFQLREKHESVTQERLIHSMGTEN